MGDKHCVYSAPNTGEGLALINKYRGSKGWNQFINKAFCAHYGLNPAVVNLPPSKFPAERDEK